MLRRSVLVLTVILLTSTVAAADADSVTLGNRGLARGTRYSEEERSVYDIKAEVDGKRIPITISLKRKKQVEVLATKDGVVTKAKVTYDEDINSEKQGDKMTTTPSSIVGKTYTLTAGATVEVQAVTGKATDAEIAEVKNREQRLMAKVLAGKTFDKSKAVDMSADAGFLFVDEDPDIEIKKVSLTYTGMDGANAKFDMKLVMGSKQSGDDFTVEASGPAVIDPATSAPISIALEGTVKQRKGGKVDGKVSISSKRTVTK